MGDFVQVTEFEIYFSAQKSMKLVSVLVLLVAVIAAFALRRGAENAISVLSQDTIQLAFKVRVPNVNLVAWPYGYTFS